MKIKAAFTAAWTSFKSFVGRADAYIVANGPKVQAAVVLGGKVAVAVDPMLAPIVTVFDTFEEALVGEISAAFHTGAALTNSTTGETTVTLSAELSGIVKQLANTLAGHPAVIAASGLAAGTAGVTT